MEDAKERRVIDASKRLSEAEQVSEEAKEDVKASRSENEESDLPSLNAELDKYNLNVIEKVMIEILGAETSEPLSVGKILDNDTYATKVAEKIPSISPHRLKIQTSEAISSLYTRDLIRGGETTGYSLTSAGYTVYDLLVHS